MSQQWNKQIEDEILRIISQSPVPEDYRHALNVREWVLRLKPDADFALQIAALGHDIERALPGAKITRKNYKTYDEFKQAHAENSAQIMRELLLKYPLNQTMIEKVCYLVRHHEFGKKGDRELGVLKDADGLSFFEINLPYYFKREGEPETLFRMKWGYARLSEKAKRMLKEINHKQNILNKARR